MAPPGVGLFLMVPVVVLFLFLMAPVIGIVSCAHSDDSVAKSLSESVMLSSDVIGEIGRKITDPVLESELYNDSSSELSVSTSTYFSTWSM